MADEEPISREEASVEEPKAAPRSQKKSIILISVFLLTFVVAGTGNFIHLQMTYVPPEPPPFEEQPVKEEYGPVLRIDLSDKPKHQGLAEAIHDSIELAMQDSISLEDSIKTVVGELRMNLKSSDSLLAVTMQELEKVKQRLKMQNAQEDSANLKRTVKLAKIVENMPAKEAAEMLTPLSDEMILDVLMRLKQRQAAKIMAEFSAQRSAKLSEVILKPLVQG